MFDHRERRPELALNGRTQPSIASSSDVARGSDEGVHWLLAAHEMLVATVLRGERHRGAPRYVEQFATASRVLLLIPASRPEYSRTVEFSRAGRELSGLTRFHWREQHHHVGMSAAVVGHRTACLRAEFEAGVEALRIGRDMSWWSDPRDDSAGARRDIPMTDGPKSDDVRCRESGIEHAEAAWSRRPRGGNVDHCEEAGAHDRCRGGDESRTTQLPAGANAREGARISTDRTHRPARCVTVTSLEWLAHSLKPRSLSFAIYYDDNDIALTASLQPQESAPERECYAIGQ